MLLVQAALAAPHTGLRAAPPAAPPAASDTRAAAPAPAGARTVELVNLGGPATAALLARADTVMGTAVAAVEAFWGTDWSRRVVLAAAGTERQFAELAGGAGADPARWADIAAVAVADRVDPRHRRVDGQQVVLAPGAARLGDAALQLVLTHELFHYAARADTALDAPRWLTEGVADFVARPHPDPVLRPAAPAGLPSDVGLDAVGPQRSAAYERAFWFARFVADRYGPAALARLYRTACGPGHPDTATALRTALGAEPAQLLQSWQRWLARPG